MAFLAFRVTFLASNRNILFQSCFCKAFLALSQNGHAFPVAGGAGVERMPGRGFVTETERGRWLVPNGACGWLGVIGRFQWPPSRERVCVLILFVRRIRRAAPLSRRLSSTGECRGAENGGMRCGVLDCTFREVLEYCAASTRVLSAKYSGVLQAAWLRAAGGAPAE